MASTATSIARTIILSTVVFAVLTSALWELLFGDGLEAVPRMALAATIGGTLWGIVFAGVTLLMRGFMRSRGAVQQRDEADEARDG
jgi:polyferredoxin